MILGGSSVCFAEVTGPLFHPCFAFVQHAVGSCSIV